MMDALLNWSIVTLCIAAGAEEALRYLDHVVPAATSSRAAPLEAPATMVAFGVEFRGSPMTHTIAGAALPAVAALADKEIGPTGSRQNPHSFGLVNRSSSGSYSSFTFIHQETSTGKNRKRE